MNSKHQLYIEIGFNIIFPLIGVFFLNWSIGDIFLLFFLEILIRGGITLLKILFSLGSGIMNRIVNSIVFCFQFAIIVFAMLVLTGNFFNGADKQMTTGLDQFTIISVTGSYFVSTLIPFFFSGEFKRTTAKKIMNDHLKYEALLFLVVLVTLLAFSAFTKMVNINYILAIGLVIGKNAAAYLISNYLKPLRP